jgi:hypothetical protein
VNVYKTFKQTLYQTLIKRLRENQNVLKTLTKRSENVDKTLAKRSETLKNHSENIIKVFSASQRS